jgi:hypothetical protein
MKQKEQALGPALSDGAKKDGLALAPALKYGAPFCDFFENIKTLHSTPQALSPKAAIGWSQAPAVSFGAYRVPQDI